MRILLVADHPGDARVVENALVSEGHTVTTCNDRHGGPCRGIADLDECPLESAVDVAVIARSVNDRRGIGEMGAVCAARHRVGVVEIDPAEPGSRSIYDLTDEADQQIFQEYVNAVTEMLQPVLGDDPFEVSVTRRERDVQVWVKLGFSCSPIVVSSVADRARAGVRHYDRFAQVIDVSVVQPASC
ncbi:MAG: response regulator [Actinomycetota bacterium]|jgi:hypothetical protein|nr:MAG: hypothetical protein FD127_697 [Acidimicrobiaceae bacterium]